MEDGNTPKARLAEIDRVLDEYERRIGMGEYTDPESSRLSELMNMSREVMERLEPSQCFEIASELEGMAFHLQRAKNRDDARVIWAESQMKKLATARIGQYQVGSYSQNFDAAVLGDGYTLKLFDIKMYAEQRSQRLDYLPSYIQRKADTFKEIGRHKGRKNG